MNRSSSSSSSMLSSSSSSAVIERVRATEVVVPMRPASADSPELGEFMDGVPWYKLPICLIETTFSDGIVALGEVGRGATLASIEPQLRQLVGTPMHGLNPLTNPPEWRVGTKWGLLERFPVPIHGFNNALAAAVEMIRLDWAGKRLGCRAVDVLGGAYRETVPVDFWCGRQMPKKLAQTVTSARQRGFRGIKMKSRAGDPVAEQVRAIKDAAGEDFAITIDPMFQWLSPHDALDTFRRIEPMSQHVRIEDPFPQDQPEMWRRVRDVSHIPLIWHARGLGPLRRGLQERCMDDFNCVGGIAEFLMCAGAVEALGYACWHGSSIELGVGQLAHLHAAAAARSCIMPSDFVSGIVREHTLITWDWPYKDGHLPLPPGAGIGVELDRDAVKKYQTASVELTGT